MTESDAVSATALYDRIRRGERVSVLDVRDRDEFEAWRIDDGNVEATQVPYSRFVQARVTGNATDLVEELSEPIVAVCARGDASDDVADLLQEEGVDAVNLADGMEGWARVYVADELELDADGPRVVQYRRPATGCLSYLVERGGEAAVVDPLRAFADRYAEDADERDADVRYAIDTHVHADHVSGVREVADLTDADVVVPEGAVDRGLSFDARTIAGGEGRSSGGERRPSGGEGRPSSGGRAASSDGDELALGDAVLRAIHAPGHTSEMTAFRVGEVLLAGDLLFLESVARPDLERGDADAEGLARTLHRTLQDRILLLPDDTVVAPGHYGTGAERAADGTYTATLGELEDRVAALSMDEDEFVSFVTGNLPPRPNEYERIVETNLGRDGMDDADAFEAELGPNNCAATSADD